MDGSYKRVNKKSKIEDLEEQLQQLRSVVASVQDGRILSQLAPIDRGYLQDSDRPLVTPTLVSTPNCSTSGLSRLSPPDDQIETSLTRDCFPLVDRNSTAQYSTLDENPRTPERLLAREPRSLEVFRLKGKQIDALFSEYFDHYHPHLSLLDPLMSPDRCYEQSPLLFWTIIATATRRYQEEPSLFAGISRAVVKLAWATISVRPHTHSTVNAILLHVAWSAPACSLATDQSYTLIGVALRAAIQLGLHRPESIQDFTNKKVQTSDQETKERAKTWVVCNLLAQSIATGLGYPALTTMDWTIEHSCEALSTYALPDDLRHHLIIGKFNHRVSNVMNVNSTNPTGMPHEHERYLLAALLEQNLDELESNLKQELSAIHHIHLTGARLNLLVYYFFASQDIDTRRKGLLKAYATASHFISQVINEDSSLNLLLYSPTNGFYILLTAAFVLLKILDSNYCKYVDFDAGKQSFNAAIIALRRWSVANNDLPARAADILAQLWRGLETGSPKRETEPQLRIDSRQGASLLYDGLWRWREEFNGQENAYPSPDSLPHDRLTSNPYRVLPDAHALDAPGWMWDFN